MDLLDPDLHTSPFKSLVFTNDPPSDLEAKSVEEFLHDHLRELSKQDEEIARVSALLDRLTNKRRHLQQHITAHQGILSPIRIFPSEILAEIFMQTLDDYYNVFDMERGPWVLGRVCRRWKDISCSCPALWTSLSIESLHLQPSFRRSRLPDILKEVLALSGNQELDIRYSSQSLIMDDSDIFPSIVPWGTLSNFWNILQQLLDTLVHHSMRWRSATFVVPFKLGRRLHKAKGRLSSLVTLDLSACERLEEDGSFDRETIDVLSVVPKLQELTITSMPDNTSLLPCPLLSFSWSQMRHLSHDCVASIEDHLRFLTGAPLLETYIANFHDFSLLEKHSHCTHSALRHLELSSQGLSPTLLQYLTCPVLKELSLGCYTPEIFSQTLYEFGDRSGCPLRQLSVKTTYIRTLEFLDSLGFNWDGWSHALFPGLMVFKMTIEYAEEDTLEILNSFIDIINARWSAGASSGLQSVSLVIGADAFSGSDFNIEDELDVLHQFKEDGLDITLKINGKQQL
ncbi:hypothetical protein EV421DRAFT_2061428 [Armillaria borealis]|uniref:F-box domain-containing protein n=1 Tax=Armillaria borealis TaxID=47425 RepID=A0AA39MIW1_9AGAR|nr:hypothetical protein EV421DRAFT_2061428 [Armillaria borealis]